MRRASRHFSLVFSIPPRSIRARRCASSWVIPCATYSSVFRSRWSRSSSSNSWSACAQRNNDRNRSGIVYSQCSGRIFDSPLLVPQSNHRIDFHRSARGNVASSESDENQQGGDGHHRERIVRADVIQHRRHETRDAYRDRKSTRLNSSHGYISYAVFCLKKKKHMSAAQTAIQEPSTSPFFSTHVPRRCTPFHVTGIAPAHHPPRLSSSLQHTYPLASSLS